MLFLINPAQFLAPGKSRTAHRAQNWCHRIKHMNESTSVNILLMTKLLSLDSLSWDMVCLLTLWPLFIPCFLDNSCCMLSFLIFIIVKRNSLYNSLYVLRVRSLKQPCPTRGLGPRVFLSLSLSLPTSLQLILWSVETHRAHSPARAFKTSSRGRPVPSWEVQALL